MTPATTTPAITQPQANRRIACSRPPAWPLGVIAGTDAVHARAVYKRAICARQHSGKPTKSRTDTTRAIRESGDGPPERRRRSAPGVTGAAVVEPAAPEEQSLSRPTAKAASLHHRRGRTFRSGRSPRAGPTEAEQPRLAAGRGAPHRRPAARARDTRDTRDTQDRRNTGMRSTERTAPLREQGCRRTAPLPTSSI